jgi:MFS family permease
VAVATCLLLGAVVARALRGVRAWIAIPLTVVVSLAGLGWWVIGIQLADGYLNAGFAIAVLLAAWLAYLESERRPVLSLLALAAAAVVMLPLWSPLVIGVGALALLVLVRLLARRSVRLVVLGLAALVVLALAATLALGIVATAVQSNDLDKDGGFPELSTPILFAFIGVILIVMIADALRMGLQHLASGAIALVAAGVIGMAYLLYQRRNSADLFGYYPEKFSWLMAVLLGVVCITVLGSLLVRRPLVGRAPRAVLGSLVVAGIGVAIVAGWVSAPERVSPVFGILSGEVFGVGNADADAVFRQVDEGRKPNPDAAASNRSNEWVDYYVSRFTAATAAAPTP